MARFCIGTSGYSYKEWRGPFYPADIAEPQMLRYYAERLASVEINYTFYRMPTVRTLQAWAKETPETFTFALKAPRRITHDLRLRDAGDLLTYFVDTAKVLKHRLGALLFQLPPFLKKDLPRLEDFLHQVPPGYRAAFEFRNPTWFSDDVYECLRRFNVAMCISDREERATPLEATADFGYFRLRRPEYNDADMAEWVERIASIETWRDAFVYFKHEQEGRGAALALAMQQRVQPEAQVAAG